MPVPEIPALQVGALPPMLINKSHKGQYKVLIYKNEWDPEKKRSYRSGSRTIGFIRNFQKDGIVSFNQAFLSVNPWMEDFVVEHKGKQWTITKRTEVESDELEEELQDEIKVQDLAKLSPQELASFLRRYKGRPLHAGASYVLGQIAGQSRLTEALQRVFPHNDDYLKLLSLAFFIVINSDNALSKYPFFAKSTLLPYAKSIDSSASTRLLSKITCRQIEDFLDIMCKFWLEEHHSEGQPIFLALDSTSISTYSATPAKANYGKNKDGDNLPQINILLLADHKTGLPVFYRAYNGAVPDVSTVSSVVRTALEFGLQHKVILVSDKGYISSDNITEAITNDLGFLFNCKVNVRGSRVQDEADKVYDKLMHGNAYNGLIRQQAVTAKINWQYDPFKVSGKRRSFSASKELYLHIYFDSDIHNHAVKDLNHDLFNVRSKLQEGAAPESLPDSEQELAKSLLNFADGQWEVNMDAFNAATRFKGVRVLVSDCVDSALEAHRQYSNRQVVESAFLTLKHRLGCDRLLTSSDASTDGKCFLQFIATTLSLMVRLRLSQWEDEVKADKTGRKKMIYLSDGNVLDELHNIFATQYKGRGLLYDEVVGKALTYMQALRVPPPETHTLRSGCQDVPDSALDERSHAA